MNGTFIHGALAIARRDLGDRRSIFVSAAFLAAIPFAVLLLPDVRSHGTETVIAATGGFVALVYLAGLALLLGATFIGRDLADKRLSFYFARPVTSSSIWFGKLAGGLCTILIAAALILVPTILASPEYWDALGRGTALFLAGVIALFLLAHAVGTMFRSRSPLILADAACAAVAAAVLYGIFNTLARGHAVHLRSWLAAGLFALLLVLLVAAGAWQLSRGRVDPVRSHRELSRFLWSAVGVVLAILGAFVLWLVSVTPENLGQRVWTAQPPAGKWMMVAGPMKHRADYMAGFYVNLQNGAYERVDPRSMWWATFFTRDGRVGGQLRPLGGRKGPVQLDVVHFGGTDVKVTPTEVTFSERTRPVLDGRATRVAAVIDGVVTVQSLPDGRTLAAARLPRAPRDVRLFFDENGRVRLYALEERGLDVYELDVPARRLHHTGFAAGTGRMLFNANADGSRLLMRAGAELLVLDGRTAAVLARLQESGRGAILSDGRIAVADGQRGRLAIYSPGYALQREIPLPGMRLIPFLREVEGGTLIVAGHHSPVANEPDGRGWTVYAIDLARGAVVRTGRDLRPDSQDFHFGLRHRDPRRTPADAGAPFVFLDRRGRVVLWDAATGSRRTVTRASISVPAAMLAAVLHLDRELNPVSSLPEPTSR